MSDCLLVREKSPGQQWPGVSFFRSSSRLSQLTYICVSREIIVNDCVTLIG